MARMPSSTWRRRSARAELMSVQDILSGVWGLDPAAPHQLEAYRDHWKESRSLINNDNLALSSRAHVVELISLVQGKCDLSVQDIESAVRAANLACLEDCYDDESASAALDFALRLWLFTEPDLEEKKSALSEVVAQKLPAALSQSHAPDLPCLSDDFSAKSLTRKGGLRLVWTSYLSEHLLLEGSQLKVFRHASALRRHAGSKQVSRLFPDDFLQETEKTLSLLFPPANLKASRRVRRISVKEGVDIEAAMKTLASFDLNNYRYWHQRLRDIQRVYDKTRPKSIKQWYFDRRDKVEWATFWIAVIVFFLTLIFGVISSVTGILQVYASFKAIRSPVT